MSGARPLAFLKVARGEFKYISWNSTNWHVLHNCKPDTSVNEPFRFVYFGMLFVGIGNLVCHVCFIKSLATYLSLIFLFGLGHHSAFSA